MQRCNKEEQEEEQKGPVFLLYDSVLAIYHSAPGREGHGGTSLDTSPGGGIFAFCGVVVFGVAWVVYLALC